MFRVSVNFLPITYPWGMSVFATSTEFKLKIKEYLEQLSINYKNLNSQFQGIINLAFSKNLTSEQVVSAVKADQIIDRLRNISTLDFLEQVDNVLYQEYKKTFSI